ncbi:FAD/NAD(P)-binding oxidoreductase [Microbacterium sp. NPDC077184]|uniref:NAD(P)/FAD-dependent oxidoreductase n=1 Tax=Microbacterium sp. NPDC077184 TaxID=3154764 RepID=UPI003417B3B2
MRDIIIAGGSIAGTTAARTLRTLGFDGRITIVEPDPHAYSRPSLSKAAMRGEDVVMPLDDGDGVRWLRGRRVVDHDPDAATVTLDDDDVLGYDGLVIATGSRAIRLGGAERDDELLVRDLHDVHALRARLVAGSKVLIVGGGLLGIELASGCRELGCAVTVVTMDPLGLRVLGDFISSRIEQWALDAGVDVVRTTARARLAEGTRNVVVVGGDVLTGDVLVTAIGDVPNVEWTPLGVPRRGVLADSVGAVADGIVVAGDAGFRRTPEGRDVRDPHWYAAMDQGRIAAHTLVGREPDRPAATRYLWTECFGHLVKLAGEVPTGPPTRVVDAGPEGSGLFVWEAGGIVRSAVAIDGKISVPRLRSMVTAPETTSD